MGIDMRMHREAALPPTPASASPPTNGNKNALPPFPEQAPVGWLLVGAAVVLSCVVLVVTALSIGRNEAGMAGLLAEKGAALIRSIESGLRTGMRSQVGIRLQAMLEEMVDSGILFVAVAMPDGTIIAHSVPERVGEVLELDGREASEGIMRVLASDAGDGDLHWLMAAMEGKRAFVVYRDFLPGKRKPPPGESHPIIFLGLDITPFETTRKQDRLHMLLTAGGLVLVGIACLLALYYAQRAHESRRRQTVAEGQVRILEEEVRRKEKLAAIGNLAAGVAHEIRNPLSSIKGYATYFGQRFPDGSEDREAAQVMVREVDRLNRVITDLIGLSRPTDVRVEPVDALAVAEHALRLLRQDAENRKVRLRLDAAPRLPLVLLDGDRFGQALLNVCLNAIEAMPQGGELALSLKPVSHGKRLCFEVRDTGTGILPEHLGHVFDPYFTTKGQGTGLGLATVHKIVEAHGGEISVASRHSSLGAPSGTVFRIVLPAAKTASGGSS